MNGSSQSIASKAKKLVTIKTTQYPSLLNRYAATQSLSKIKQLHACAIVSGSPESAHLRSLLAASYAKCGSYSHASKIFDEFPQRNVYLCNLMMKIHVNNGFYFDVIKVFVEMLQSRGAHPDSYTYNLMIKACSESLSLGLGRVIHGKILVSVFGFDTFVLNSLLAMYMNCGKMEAAGRVFEMIRERSVVSWNTMINGYFKNGCAQLALRVFRRMVDSGVEIDGGTVVSVLPVCGNLKELDEGRRVHKLVEEKGLGKKIEVRNALVDMYVKCGSMSEARLVFDSMVERDVVSWTSMINGYILNGDARNALELSRIMQNEGIRPNSVTIALFLVACASLNYLKDGLCLHGWVIRQQIDAEVIVETSLIDMYAKCNRLDLSFRVFARTSRKRVIPCNAMISGCIHNGLATEAIGIFKKMLMEGVESNEATFNGLLPAYAVLADFHPAKNIHCHLITSGFLSKIKIATCLIDIYSKCGNIEYARMIFDAIPMDVKDIFVWSVIIASYGMHGHGEKSVSLFRQMIQSGVKPNEVTFTSVLHACSHSGMVDEGLFLLKFMLKEHRKSTNDDHYACIVDLLGRSGRLGEGYDLIRTMPFSPSHAVWGALLGACVIHENVDLGELAAQKLFELEPENTGNYVLLGKLYCAAGRWKDAANVRLLMGEHGLRKAPALSLVNARSK